MSAGSNHEERINRALAVAYRREGRLAQSAAIPMGLAEIFELARGDGAEALAIKEETAKRLMFFLFQDGPHPGCVIRLAYLLAQKIAPELVMHMSGAELADILGETRAAYSARLNRIFTGYLKGRGFKATRGGFQKSAAHAQRCAQAQAGNTNRRGKLKKAA